MKRETCRRALVLFLCCAGAVLITGCGDVPGVETSNESVGAPTPQLLPIDPPAAPGSLAPQLSPGSDGFHLTWLEKDAAVPSGGARGGDTVHHLRLATWDGQAWSEPRTVTTSDRLFANWADRPSVVEGPGGVLLAHWLQKLGADTYAYGVETATSADGGVTWRSRGLLHDDVTPTEHGFVAFVSGTDAIQAFWLDGRAMPGGGGMQLRTTVLSADALTDPKARLAGVSTVLDDRVCECCATDAVLTSNGPLVAYRDRAEGEIRDISVIRADGDGWTPPQEVSRDGWEIHGCPVNGPVLAGRGHDVALAWFTGAGGQARVRLALSHDAGATFAESIEIDDQEPLGRLDVVLDDDGGALVSWLGTSGQGEEREGELRLRRVSRDGVAGPPRVLMKSTTGRSAGVPRIIRHDGGVVLSWVEDTERDLIHAARLERP